MYVGCYKGFVGLLESVFFKVTKGAPRVLI